jgi:hypothetical protein
MGVKDFIFRSKPLQNQHFRFPSENPRIWMQPFGTGEGPAATMPQSGESPVILNLPPSIFKRNNDAPRMSRVAKCPFHVAHWGWTSFGAGSMVRRIGRLYSLFG